MLKRFVRLALLAIIFSTPLTVRGASEINETVMTVVPSAVEVTVVNTGATSGVITSDTGTLSQILRGQFQVKTNGDDSKYEYIMTADVPTQGGATQNAYFRSSGNSYIILGNNTASLQPTLASITDIKSGSPTKANNANAIAYPMSAATTFESVSISNISAYGGLCYKVIVQDKCIGTVTQSVNTTPFTNTYSTDNDNPGTYQATVTFSIYRKP